MLGSGAFGQTTGDPAATTPAEESPAPEAATEVAGEPPVEEEPPLYKTRSERDNHLLAQAAPEEVRWLDIPGEQALALFRPTATSANKGVVLILHAAEVPPGWPPALENVRRTLPQHGWVTFALALPPKSPAPTPAREPDAPIPVPEPADPASEVEPAATEPPATEAVPIAEEPAPAEAAAEEPAPSRSEIIAQRFAAALEWLAQEQHTPVVLLIDNSSVVEGFNYLQSRTDNPIVAMILVNLQTQEALTTAQLEAIFTATTPPTLDVFFEPGQGKMTATRKSHRAVALRNKLPVYQQLHLPPQLPATLDDEKSFWVERLRGFVEQQMRAKKE